MSTVLTATEVTKHLREKINPAKTAFYPSFFKTGPDEYGEFDRFPGVVVPDQRKIARKFRELNLREIAKLLDSPWHECRLTGLLILVDSSAHKNRRTLSTRPQPKTTRKKALAGKL